MEMIVKFYDKDEYGNEVYARRCNDDTNARFRIEYCGEDYNTVDFTAYYEDPNDVNKPYKVEGDDTSRLVCFGLSLHTLDELIDALSYARKQMLDVKAKADGE